MHEQGCIYPIDPCCCGELDREHAAYAVKAQGKAYEKERELHSSPVLLRKKAVEMLKEAEILEEQ